MNKFSWTQTFDDFPLRETKRGFYRRLNAKERCQHIENWIRDPNIGTQNLRFKVVAVEPRSDGDYRIRLNASTNAINKILRNWNSGQYYTVNGKRRMT